MKRALTQRHGKATTNKDVHCLHHLLQELKTLPIQLRPANHNYHLPICKYELYKRSFIVRSLFNYLRAVGRKVLWSSACVCLCALFLSARYLKNGFMDHHQIWWGWTSRTSSILVLIGFRMRIQDHFSISVNLDVGHGQRAGMCPPRTQ